ncbi:MAG: VOC family protein [Chloroflexi bacterium]|nr:VOC family protein [Chloroflexota bacterium]
MLRSIDHIVILVRDLTRAAADYERAGFTVTPGGEHADGTTHNALIPFADGTYCELIAFKEPDRPVVHKWWPLLAAGGGLIDYALAADDLAVEAARLRQAGLPIGELTEGGRMRPDGERLRWRTLPVGRGAGRPSLPFLIEDLTPRTGRVPGGPATRHALGARRLAGLTLVTADIAGAARAMEHLLGPDARQVPARPAVEGKSFLFRIGLQWLELLQPADPTSEAGLWLHDRGEGPYEVVLTRGDAAGPGDGQLIAGNLHGARIRLA